jgi:hypothetical protein
MIPVINIRPPMMPKSRKEAFCEERYLPVSFDLIRSRYFLIVPSIMSFILGKSAEYFLEMKKSARK